MLSHEERSEIREEVYRDLAEIEFEASHHAGSYNFLCNIAGSPTFTHRPVGQVLRAIPHLGVV